MATEIYYSNQQGGTVHHFALNDSQLIYWQGETAWEFRLDLRHAEFTVKRKRVFSRFWYVGLIGVALPLFTFGMIYRKERVIFLEGAGWFHLGFLIIGLLLLFFFRHPAKVYEVKTKCGSRIRIYDDPAQPGAADELAEAIQHQNRK